MTGERVGKRAISYSEADMSDAFARFLNGRRARATIGPLWKIFREVSCLRGRPDFLALQRNGSSRARSLKDIALLGECGTALLAVLETNQPHALDYLVHHTRFTMASVRRSLKELAARNIAVETPRRTWLLAPSFDLGNLEIWAFELKIRDVRRAIFQAQQYALFAHRVCIVLPPERANLVPRFEKSLASWGIGVALFDPKGSVFSLIHPPRRNAAASRRHGIYALSMTLRAA
jgi:hypothetical protein